MRALLGIPSLVLGIVVVAIADGDVAQLVGLGLWWVGVLLLVDLWLGDGLPAQFLWGLGTALAVWVYSSDRAQVVVLEHWVLIITGVGVVLILMLLQRLGTARRPQLAEPARPAMKVAEGPGITGLLRVMERYAVQVSDRGEVGGADPQQALRRYRDTHGSDTVSSSAAPPALQGAVVRLGRELEGVRQRQPIESEAYVAAVVLTRYAELLADLTLEQERV
ncbi:hypothetical protein E0H73_16075 [Kribbella pittospori]|uniref:Uncharacterized protein n=1 Tax=Kribbella pittospori TaxID=722689 RepID=A0A4R0KN92_9ACTN|nr:hypothetical protein [Kribbella pittospori]TCC62221.1 hypothetical protein E0H73_16075 [Kribbella pittospori]